MRVPTKKSTLVVTAATVAILGLVGSAFAQSGARGPVDMRSPPTAASVYAHKKADDAMARLHDVPETDANHKKAAAAMVAPPVAFTSEPVPSLSR